MHKRIEVGVVLLLLCAFPGLAWSYSIPRCNSCQQLQCDNDLGGGKPTCICAPLTGPDAVDGNIIPKFYVMHVVYAVPGAKVSKVTYQQGASSGSTTSSTKTFKQGTTVTVKSGGGFLFFKGGLNVSAGRSWGSTQIDTTDLQFTRTEAFTKPGLQDYPDHDYDEIWFLANPILDVSLTPQWRCGPATASWQFSANQGFSNALPYFMYAGELKGTLQIPDSVTNDLKNFGIGAADFPQLLAADPLAWTDGSISDLPVDTSRFQLVDVEPYIPLPFPGAMPDTSAVMIQQQSTDTSSLQDDVTYTASITAMGGLGFLGLAEATYSVDNQWTWTESSSKKTSNGVSSQDSWTVGQPAYGFNGGTFVRVYEDTVWKTYAFFLTTH